MKKTTVIYVTLLLGLLLALTGPFPLQAQEAEQNPEPLNAILARAAAKGFLITLTRPELSDTMQFYLQDNVRVEGLLESLGDVSGYEISRAGWLQPDEVYEVEALLQPANRTILIRTSQLAGRWQVEGIELDPAETEAAGSTSGEATTAANQPRPIAGNGSGRLAFQTKNAGDIYIINADGTGLRRVTQGIDPQLSPDGSQIAFTRWAPKYELFTINVDGTNERAWFSNKRQMKSPTWSADGSRLTFSYQAGGRLNPKFVKVSLSTLAERIAKGDEFDIPRNARGVEIAENNYLKYTIPADAFWWLAEIDLVDQEYQDLYTGARYNYASNGHPTDPNKVLFRADKGIGLLDTESQQTQRVSTDDRDRGPVALSPDGTKVAFTYNQDGHWEIHTINLDGSNRQRLTQTPLTEIVKNSRSEVYVNEEGFMTTTRAQPESMPNPNWNNAAPAWSPDGSQIAFMTDRTGPWEIWIMNVDGSNQRPMFPNGALADLEFDYAGVDERMISWR